MRLHDVAGLTLGTFVRPAEETHDGHSRVETVLGYVADTAPGCTLLLDTGLGDAGPEVEAWYRRCRVALEDALDQIGLTTDEIDLVVACHLHFGHIGTNPTFHGRPIFCQRTERDTARKPDYRHLIRTP